LFAQRVGEVRVDEMGDLVDLGGVSPIQPKAAIHAIPPGSMVVTREYPGLARTRSGHRPPHCPVAARGAPFGDPRQPPARLLRRRRIARCLMRTTPAGARSRLRSAVGVVPEHVAGSAFGRTRICVVRAERTIASSQAPPLL